MAVDDTYEWVHVDEKCLSVVRNGARIYSMPGEEVANHPRRPGKCFISKVMCLVAVARPWQLSNGAWFNGKIAIWPVNETVKAKCSSKNRAAGDMEIKPVTVDREQYKKITKKVIPALKAKMSGTSSGTLWV
ncbi:unnamed protein product [Discosporangium mesarthrocarpum]